MNYNESAFQTFQTFTDCVHIENDKMFTNL